jgi:hypothetical protein
VTRAAESGCSQVFRERPRGSAEPQGIWFSPVDYRGPSKGATTKLTTIAFAVRFGHGCHRLGALRHPCPCTRRRAERPGIHDRRPHTRRSRYFRLAPLRAF